MSFFVKTAMKILPVTQNRISAPSNINNTRAFSVKTNSLPDDIFIKSAPANKISFNGLGRFDERFIPLCKDLQEYLAKNTPVNYDDITKIIRKYVQGIDLYKMSELSQKSNATAAHGAYFENLHIYTPDGKCIQGKQGIYINLPKSNNLEDRIKFSEFLVHEMTHALQETSSDRTPLSKWMNDYLRNAKMNNDTVLTIQLMPKIFTTFEYNVSVPLYKALNKNNYIPLPISEASNEVVNAIYKDTTGISADKFADFMIAKTPERLGLPDSLSNIKKIIEYAKLKTENEKEAIGNATDFIKNILNIKGPTDLDLRVNLYDIIQQKLQYIISQL